MPDEAPSRSGEPPATRQRARGSRLVIVAWCLLASVQSAIYLAVPLMPGQNDSAWYFMGARYILTGEFIHEARFPSFHGPSQVYAVGGYGAPILASLLGERWMGADWVLLLRLQQLMMYLGTGLLLYRIGVHVVGRGAAAVAVLLYQLWFPCFNFAEVIMSEVWGTSLLVALLAAVLEGCARRSRRLVTLGFLLTGYAALVKPVFLALVPILLALVAVSLGRRPRLWAVLAGAVALPLLAQSVASRILYGNYAILRSVGWHLWNRVLMQDQLIPTGSPALARLETIFASHGEALPLAGPWWEVTARLSAFGFDESQTQELCRSVAIAGIRAHPGSYVLRTLTWGVGLARAELPTREVHDGCSGFMSALGKFGRSGQHRVLTEPLLRQGAGCGRRWRDLGIRIYAGWYRLFSSWIGAGTYVVLLALQCVWGLLAAVRLAGGGPWRESVPRLAVALTPWTIALGSSASELFEPRYALTSFPLVLLGACGLGVDGLHTARRRRSARAEAGRTAPATGA